jgi:hypothetical protein
MHHAARITGCSGREHPLQVIVPLVEVLVPVPRHDPEHVEALGPDTPYKEALVCRHRVHGQVLDAHEHHHRVDRGEVGDEVGEDVRDAAGQLGVHEPDPRHRDQAQARPSLHPSDVDPTSSSTAPVVFDRDFFFVAGLGMQHNLSSLPGTEIDFLDRRSSRCPMDEMSPPPVVMCKLLEYWRFS